MTHTPDVHPVGDLPEGPPETEAPCGERLTEDGDRLGANAVEGQQPLLRMVGHPLKAGFEAMRPRRVGLEVCGSRDPCRCLGR